MDEDAEINGWNEYEKFLAAKRVLTGVAQPWFDGRRASSVGIRCAKEYLALSVVRSSPRMYTSNFATENDKKAKR